MTRKNGFYWVKTFAIKWAKEPEKWIIAEYENDKWFVGRTCFSGTDFVEIDEHKIIKSKNHPVKKYKSAAQLGYDEFFDEVCMQFAGKHTSKNEEERLVHCELINDVIKITKNLINGKNKLEL